MRKIEYIELIKHRLSKFDKTGKYHDMLVEGYITLATNQMLQSIFDLDLHTKLYKNVPILQDEDTEEYYSDFPAPIVDTIDVANGVRKINTMTGRGLQFAPIRGGELTLVDGLDVLNLSDVIGYNVQDDRILYMGEPRDEDYNIIEEVRMNLVVPFSAYGMTDHYRIPGGNDMNLFEVVLQIMSGIPPRDQFNDNKDPVIPQETNR
jgi:hypothetical protein